jgi:HAD superfamily hydrolase (TIGR01549 family)
MHPSIEAIFLDVGDTLRLLVPDEPYQGRARKRIADLVETRDSPEAFCIQLEKNYKDYRKWAFEQMQEASEVELWTRWMAPGFPAEKIAPLAGELSFQFRQSKGRRVLAADGKQVIVELDRRGYILGIISNVITRQEIPDWLAEDGLTPYFKSVALSSVLGKRKPDPAIYHYAAQQAGVEPARCAYVGDNPNRDVVGTRNAGFGLSIIVSNSPDLDPSLEKQNLPDLIIHKLSDLLDIFPQR